MTKTIRVDQEVYDTISAAKEHGESIASALRRLCDPDLYGTGFVVVKRTYPDDTPTAQVHGSRCHCRSLHDSNARVVASAHSLEDAGNAAGRYGRVVFMDCSLGA